ncbi:MAG: hypothetical protein WCG23_04630 [bacterium]
MSNENNLKYCHFCGTKLLFDDEFCSNCGKKVKFEQEKNIVKKSSLSQEEIKRIYAEERIRAEARNTYTNQSVNTSNNENIAQNACALACLVCLGILGLMSALGFLH